MTETFYVTTPIYYVNAKPHLGHAYTTLVADSLTRFKRQRGVDSFFLTGTDEHGVNVERAAAALDIPVKQHVDHIVDQFKAAFARLGVEYDRWIRTTDSFHEEAVQKLWKILDERGYIYKGNYEEWFCPSCNEFKDHTQYKEYSEIVKGLEKSVVAAIKPPVSDGPYCTTHLRELERVAEESYFFRLSAFQQQLLDLNQSRPEFVQPEVRRNEVVSFVSGGLKDLSISRVSVKWGIPVPGDPSHTVYVWFDALSNYITALGWGNSTYHEFDRFWPALHLIGKDILRMHTVYWPSFLMAAGIELPRQVHVHGMLLRGGQKMGKTLGNFIDLGVLHRHFTNDMIRYFLLREVAFGQDGEVTYEALIDRVNSDLADGIGNLASRTLTMVKNYFAGQPPRVFDVAEPDESAGVRDTVERSRQKFDEEFNALNFSRALEAAWAGIARVDKYITDNQPWKLAKDPSAGRQLEVVISTAYEALRHLVVLVAPSLPDTTRQIWTEMGLDGEPLNVNPNRSGWGEQISIRTIDRVTPAFPKLAKDKIMAEIEKEQPAQPQQAPVAETKEAGAAGIISIDDFAKVELRAATVLKAERVPKADKLLRLEVEIGEQQPRQILAGIAQYYSPEDVVGRKIIVVSNLAPRKLRGLESNGMLLAASIGEEGRPVLATFAEDVPNGARLK
ncbi:MAG TPA: methionine--tRNA ligase [Blastocatellia bacterium]|nr:methionine--tRNA ligase [Blastocatellia bacterium]